MSAQFRSKRPRDSRGPSVYLISLAMLMMPHADAVSACVPGDQEGKTPPRAQLESGRDLFLREWLPGDSRSPGGDGLGPVFNDSSCVACHNSGAPGGAGPNSKNVDILSAASNSAMMGGEPQIAGPPRFFDLALESLLGIEPVQRAQPAMKLARARRPDRSQLIAMHPGFRSANSIVIHRFAAEPGYENWRNNTLGMGGFGGVPGAFDPDVEINMQRMTAQNEPNLGQFQSQVGSFLLSRSQRNPTALFGAGLIDSISDDVLLEQSKKRFQEFPEIAGRVSRSKDKRIGRFGWKAQTPSLEDFVLTACAVELGLEVPGHGQGGLPAKPEQKAKGLDLTAEQCAALTAYVRNLPKPTRENADDPDIQAGRELFSGIGCANCHVPKLGDVDGIYSDLLLHDMGQDLGDTGQYGVFVPDSAEPDIEEEPGDAGVAQNAPAAPGDLTEQQVAQLQVATRGSTLPAPTSEVPIPPGAVATVAATPPVFGASVGFAPQVAMFGGRDGVGPNGIALNRPKDGPASRQEWRTPPLWGLRDSGPYLHDGRASTLERAIVFHGGEGTMSMRKYFRLDLKQRMQLQAFLKSLCAPMSDGVAVAAR